MAGSGAEFNQAAPNRSLRLLLLVFVVFVGFLAIAIPLPVLTAQVHETLGYGTLVAGWVIGFQSVATVLTRQYAGTRSDARGPKAAVLIGLPAASLAGIVYLASAVPALPPAAALALLTAGRLTMGFAESLILVGTMTWMIGYAGPGRSGKVMAWQGIAMYAALGAGAPIGLALQDSYGFAGVAVATLSLPLVALSAVLRLPAVAPTHGRRLPFYKVIGRVWRPGTALALGSVPLVGLTAFIALHHAAHGWPGAGLATAAFGAAFILVRLFLADLPDRIGGTRVAVVSLAVETAGQLLIWSADSPLTAAAGAAVTGLGLSLVFPALGVEALNSVPPQNRGLAAGGYAAFLDLSIGITGPATGAIVAAFGYDAAFLGGAAATGLAVPLVLSLRGDRPLWRPLDAS